MATKLEPVHPNQIATVLCHLGTRIGVVDRRRRSGLASCVNTIKPGAVPLAALLHRGEEGRNGGQDCESGNKPSTHLLTRGETPSQSSPNRSC